MKMNCDQIQPKLLDYSRGRTSGPDEQIIAAHLSRCAECSAVLEEERALAARLASVSEESPARDVWDTVRERIAPTPRQLPLRAALRIRLAASMAVVAALGIGLFYGFREPQKSIEPSSSAPSVSAITVKWSDDPLAQHTEALIRAIDEM